MAKKIDIEFASIGARELSANLKSLSSQFKSFGTQAKRYLGYLIGREVTDGILKFQKSLFDLSKASKFVGSDFKRLKQSMETINKTTSLSRAQSAQFLRQLQQNQKGIRLTAKESADFAKVLSTEFGPAVDDVTKAMETLVAVQNKEIFLLKNLKSNMDPKDVEDYAMSLFSAGKASEEQAIAIIRTADAYAKAAEAAKNQTAQQKSDAEKRQKALLAYRKSVADLQKTWDNLQKTIGGPVTTTLTKVFTVMSNLGNKIDQLIKKSKGLQEVLKMLPLAAGGIAGASALAGAAKFAGAPLVGGARAVGRAGRSLGRVGSALGVGRFALPGAALAFGGRAVGNALQQRGMERAGAGVRAAGAIGGGAAIGASVGSVIPGVGTAIGGVVGGLAGLLTSLDDLQAAFPGLQGVLDAIKQQFSGIMAVLQPVIDAGRELAQTVFAELKNIFGALFDAVKQVLPILLEAQMTLGKSLVKAVTALLKYLKPVVSIIGTALTAAIKALTPVLVKLAEVYKWMIEKISSGLDFLSGVTETTAKQLEKFSAHFKKWIGTALDYYYGKTETDEEKASRKIREKLLSQEGLLAPLTEFDKAIINLKKKTAGLAKDDYRLRKKYAREIMKLEEQRAKSEKGRKDLGAGPEAVVKVTTKIKKELEKPKLGKSLDKIMEAGSKSIEKGKNAMKDLAKASKDTKNNVEETNKIQAFEKYATAYKFASEISEKTNAILSAQMKIAEVSSLYEGNLEKAFNRLFGSLDLINFEEHAWKEVLGILEEKGTLELKGKQLQDEIAKVVKKRGFNEEEEKGIISTLTQGVQNRADVERKISETVERRMSVMRAADKQLQARTSLAGSEVALMEAQINLTKSLYLGLGPTLEVQLQTVNAIEKQIDAVDKQLSLWRAIAKEQPGNIEAQQKLRDLQRQKTGLVQKELDITKNLREGYLNAMTAFSNVEGFFAKMVMKQDYGIDVLQQMGAAAGLRVGARGAGGESPIAKFQQGGRLQLAGGPYGFMGEFTKRAQRYGDQILPTPGMLNISAAMQSTGAGSYFTSQAMQRQSGLRSPGQQVGGPTPAQIAAGVRGGGGKPSAASEEQLIQHQINSLAEKIATTGGGDKKAISEYTQLLARQRQMQQEKDPVVAQLIKIRELLAKCCVGGGKQAAADPKKDDKKENAAAERAKKEKAAADKAQREKDAAKQKAAMERHGQRVIEDKKAQLEAQTTQEKYQAQKRALIERSRGRFSTAANEAMMARVNTAGVTIGARGGGYGVRGVRYGTQQTSGRPRGRNPMLDQMWAKQQAQREALYQERLKAGLKRDAERKVGRDEATRIRVENENRKLAKLAEKQLNETKKIAKSSDKTSKATEAAAKKKGVNVHGMDVTESAVATTTVGNIAKKAMGGQIPGYGGGDTQVIAAERGEFIVRKEAAAQHGGLLRSINGMAAGGPVIPNPSVGGGSFSPRFNIAVRGDTMKSVLKGVQHQLAKTLSDMMRPVGTTGRFFDLPQSG